jgi:hypothetical protein
MGTATATATATHGHGEGNSEGLLKEAAAGMAIIWTLAKL